MDTRIDDDEKLEKAVADAVSKLNAEVGRAQSDILQPIREMLEENGLRLVSIDVRDARNGVFTMDWEPVDNVCQSEGR